MSPTKIYDINDDYQMISINKKSKLYSSVRDNYDIMIIKLNEDDINIKNYLEIDNNIFKNNSEFSYKDEPIYILHYPNAEKPSISYGTGIEKINMYDIKHLCNTESGSSGGPILCSMTNKVIGLHKGFIKNKFNIGTFLKFPLNDLNHKNDEKSEVSLFKDIHIVKRNNNKKYDYKLRYILLGDTFTGKSKIVQGFIQKNYEDINTINYDGFVVDIQIRENLINLLIIDVGGGRTILTFPLNKYLKNVQCAIIVYDITNRESFDNLKFWIDMCDEYCEVNTIRVLVGNKCEQEDKRKVSFEEGKKFAENHNLKFYEATYITGKNINNIFFYPTYQIYEKIISKKIILKKIKKDNCFIV